MINIDYYNYINNIAKFKNIVIITGNLSGGSFKWIKDLNIIQKNNVYLVKRKKRLIRLIHKYNKNLIIILQSFINTNINVNLLLRLKNKFKFNFILPIHDWYWLIYPYKYKKNKDTLCVHNIYLNYNKYKLHKIVEKIFKLSFVICPSVFVYKIIKKNIPQLKRIYVSNWQDIKPINLPILNKLVNNCVNIGMFSRFCDYKGKEHVIFLKNNVQKYKGYIIKYFIVGKNIEKYKDNYKSFSNLCKKYEINGLLYLNKWGETWCYSLTKGLISGLPIFYNNIGVFKERISKNKSKYIININSESEFYNYNKLKVRFKIFLDFLINNYSNT